MDHKHLLNQMSQMLYKELANMLTELDFCQFCIISQVGQFTDIGITVMFLFVLFIFVYFEFGC